MIEFIVVSIFLGIILFFIHFFCDRIHIYISAHKMKTASFTAGIFVTYFFLHLMPEIYKGDITTTKFALLFGLIGFTLFHIVEKHTYKKTRGYSLKRRLGTEHSIAFFLYHLVIGIVIVNLLRIDLLNGVLFFIPIMLFTAISSLSLKGIHDVIVSNRLFRTLLSISTLVGIVFALFLTLTPIVYFSVFGFIIGSLIYVLVMDAIPKEREGSPLFFLIGVVIYSIIIILTVF